MSEPFKCPACGYTEKFKVLESIVHVAVPDENNPGQLQVIKAVNNEIDDCFCDNCGASVYFEGNPVINFG